MVILGAVLFFLMGLTLGLVGAGGAILTIPLLIYIVRMPVMLATTYSLFIVGTTASFGVLLRLKRIAFKQTWLLAIPSILGVFIARALVIPILPEHLGWLSRDAFFIILLVLVMFLAAFFMIKKHSLPERVQEKNVFRLAQIIAYGLVVGFVMGLLGAGGGFLIIPILVLLLGIDMKAAVGSSLFIIMLNSFVGFLSDHHDLDASHYQTLFFYSSLSLCGMGLGTYLSSKVSAQLLKDSFGWLIAALALVICVREFFIA